MKHLKSIKKVPDIHPVEVAKKINKVNKFSKLVPNAVSKKPLGKRFAETFIGGDAKGVSGYVLFDVLIPAAKDMVVDAGQEALHRIFYTDSTTRNRRANARSGSSSLGHVAYNRYAPNSSGGRREEPRSNPSRRARATHDFDEIILATRVEAEEVVDRLFDLVSRYESATVADLYELVGVAGSYTDDKWGWTDIRGAGVSRVRNGYLLDLPRPEPLD